MSGVFMKSPKQSRGVVERDSADNFDASGL